MTATSSKNIFIGLDTEYHTNKIGQIDNVYCVCCTDKNGKQFKKWTSETKDSNIVKEIAQHYDTTAENLIIIVHAFDLAERRALKFLGVDNSKYKFLDTCYLAKMLQKSFSKADSRLTIKHDSSLTEDERLEFNQRAKAKKLNAISYAVLCHKYNLALIDTEHKQEMRNLCINNTTEGHEQEILDYCAEDTAFLLPLFKCLFSEYFTSLKGSFCPLNEHRFDSITADEAIRLLTTQMAYVNDFGDIADNGLLVNRDRVDKVKVNALKYREQLKAKFNEKYPGVFTIGKDGLYHESSLRIQTYMQRLISDRKIIDYPTTPAGKISTSSDTLKDYFKGQDCFGEDYRQLNKLTRTLNSVAKQSDSPFDSIIEDADGNSRLWYESLQPYGTITSRCTPSTKRFIFGWHKSLYGILEPPKGKWLVELDYGSEETFCQACICKDAVYNKIYQSKDIYLAFATLMGEVPAADFKSLPIDELKHNYKAIRSMIKPMILGLSYGMGASKLAKRCGISQTEAEQSVNKINGQILATSTKYKSSIRKRSSKCKAFSLPDGFICQYNERTANATTVGNWPFQSAGGMILRHLVKNLMKQIREGRIKTTILATIHDAIFFEVDENDYETINKVASIMKESANYILSAPESWSIKVGEPDIIKTGDIWCTDDESFVEQFKKLLHYSE